MTKQELKERIQIKKIGSGTYHFTYKSERKIYTITSHDTATADNFDNLTVSELKQLTRTIKFFARL